MRAVSSPAQRAWRPTEWSGATRLGQAVQRVEWLLLLAAAPFMLFPNQYTLLGLGLIGISWLARRLATGRWSVRSPADGPVVVVLVMLGVSLVPSVRLDYSAPKFWGLVLGLATLFACLNTGHTPLARQLAPPLLIGAGAVLAAVGVLVMAVPPDKLLDQGFFALLPRVLTPIQTSTIVTTGINPNELAGTLALLIPLMAVFAVAGGWLRVLALPAAALSLGVLVLTQSRGALVGVGLALALGAVWRGGRRPLLLLTGVATLAVVSIQAGIGVDVTGVVTSANGVAADRLESLTGRLELWQRGALMVEDMPLTGIGLNTFPLMLDSFYPLVRSVGSEPIPHAHDLYLQTALDLGVPGLGAFLVLVGLAVRRGLSAARQPLALGLLLGLIAHGIYSLVDAVALGAKPGPILWVCLGLLLTARVQPASLPPLESADEGPALAGHARPVTARSTAWRRPVIGAIVLVGVPLLVAPVLLNAALLVLHRSGQPIVATPVVGAVLEVAQRVAWGPYNARVLAAQALAAHGRGDTASELRLLAAASAAAPWDPTLALTLGDRRLSVGDRAGALDAWRSAGLVEPLLIRGADAQSADALEWFALAQAVDAADWRPYASAAQLLATTQGLERAAPFLAEALRLRGAETARQAIADRLVQPTASLPSDTPISTSKVDTDLYLRASETLASRHDLAGAVYAAQLAIDADPGSEAARLQLARLRPA